MKNRATKRLLSWLMSAVMIVGEFGGMPLAANAQIGEQGEVIEKEVFDEEAAIEDEAAFGVSQEETLPSEDEESVVEEAQNDPDPVQKDVVPVKGDGFYTWEPLTDIEDYSDGWKGEDGTFYLNGGYGLGVSISDNAAADKIIWVGGTCLYRTGEENNYSAEGRADISELILDMICRKLKGNDVINGDYYLYVGCETAYSKASDQPFTFTYEVGGADAVAGWYLDLLLNRWLIS